MKRNILAIFVFLLNLIVFAYYLLGLMQLQPLYIALPLQFGTLLLTIYLWNRRNQFRGRGFKKEKFKTAFS
ncbi:hypothetical protein LC040_01445 [Bacillus tianshenii]|nr:hypothetical protein LC040_01445 [Bacillus tianshenii]